MTAMSGAIATPCDIKTPCGITTQYDLSTQYDIAIVGGGLVGMSLALLLAQQRADWRIVLLDANAPQAQREPSFDTRSTALSKGSQTLLEGLGVWDQLASQCADIQQIQVSDRGRWAGAQLSAQEFDLDALGYVAENTSLIQALSEQLALSEQVQSFHSVTVSRAIAQPCLKDHARLGYALNWQTEEAQGQLHTRMVVIADGVQSPLRRQLGIDADIHDYEQSAVVANVRLSKPHNHHAFERFTPDGPLALLPLADASPNDQGRRMALVWTHPQARLQEWQSQMARLPEKERDQQWLERLQAAIGFRLGAVELMGRRSLFPLHRVISRESVRSHLAVIGNAAHFLHPVAGQGFNLALRDSARLANILGDAWRHEPLANFGRIQQLKAYPMEQSRDQLLTVSGSHGLVKLFGHQSLLSRAARSVGLWEMEQIPWIKRAFTLHTLGFAPYQLSNGFPAKEGA